MPKTHYQTSKTAHLNDSRLGNGQLVRRRGTIDNQFDLSRCII